MPPKFAPRESLGADRVIFHCSICHRALWPDADHAAKFGVTDDGVVLNIAIRLPRPDDPPALRRWDGFVFCPEHAAERGIS